MSNYEKFIYQACPSSLEDIRFSVSAVNDCGESTRLYGKIKRDCGGGPIQPLNFSVYPNPNNGEFAIYLNNQGDNQLNLRSKGSDYRKCTIYDLQGKIIKDFLVKDDVKYVRGLASGVYIIKVQDGASQSVEKVIIN